VNYLIAFDFILGSLTLGFVVMTYLLLYQHARTGRTVGDVLTRRIDQIEEDMRRLSRETGAWKVEQAEQSKRRQPPDTVRAGDPEATK
jgi:hypothetical protein